MKNAEMLLWTIIDKEIFLERNPYYQPDTNCDDHIVNWFNNLEMLVHEPDFPNYLQFWTRTGNDGFYQKQNQWDLKHPHIWWDNHQVQNVLVLPDPYMFALWDKHTHRRECVARNSAETGYLAAKNEKFLWGNKINKAVFRGANTGFNVKPDKKSRLRLRLMELSFFEPDHLEVYFSQM